MSRIQARLNQLRNDNRRALVPYLVAGDPEPTATVAAMQSMVGAGADIIELGVPFSDPMAEGPVIQLAHERALTHAVSLRDVLAMVANFRRGDADTPVVLMGYANPVERMGYGVFADAAAQAGVDGLLVVDMPPEEAEDLNAELKRVGIDAIFLLAPTTTEQRMRQIAELASGYLYCVSLKGVTGAGNLDVDAVSAQVSRIKSVTDLPVAVGFGIKDGASAAAIAKVADGVVVGSALVDRMARAGSGRVAAEAAALVGEIRAAIDA